MLAFSATLWPPLTMGFLAAFSAGAINPILGAVAYERIPPQLLARVMGVVKASAWVGIPFGPLLGGLLVEALGLRPALLIAGALFLLATLPPFILNVFTEMNRNHRAVLRSHPWQFPAPVTAGHTGNERCRGHLPWSRDSDPR